MTVDHVADLLSGRPIPEQPMDRRCTATSTTTGERCKRTAIRGGTVCYKHGGAAPQVKAKAQRRLAQLVDPALKELERLLKTGTPDAVRLRAVTEILDRAGVTVTQRHEVEAVVFTLTIGDQDRTILAPPADDEQPEPPARPVLALPPGDASDDGVGE